MLRSRSRPSSVRTALAPAYVARAAKWAILPQRVDEQRCMYVRDAMGLRKDVYSLPSLHGIEGRGIHGFLSPNAMNIAWTQYQQMMIDKVRSRVVGTDLENVPFKNILIRTSRDPAQADLFNAASMAHNNQFFFAGLTRDNSSMPQALKQMIESNFQSVEVFKQEFLGRASAMFGPGYVWLVKLGRHEKKLSILTTYLAGTPFAEAHNKLQSVDMNTRGAESNDKVVKALFDITQGLRRQDDRQTGLGGAIVTPLICVSTWQHIWLADYGVYSNGIAGKDRYLNNWWRFADWSKAYNHFEASDHPGFKTQ